MIPKDIGPPPASYDEVCHCEPPYCTVIGEIYVRRSTIPGKIIVVRYFDCIWHGPQCFEACRTAEYRDGQLIKTFFDSSNVYFGQTQYSQVNNRLEEHKYG